MLLAFIIHVFHCCVVAFMVLVPFVHVPPGILILHAVGGVCLLVHWFANNDACSLTMMETTLRGVSKEEALSHKFIGPLYNISDNTWSNVIHVITIGLVCTSVYKLFNDTRCMQSYIDLMNLINKPGFDQLEIKERLSMYLQTCRPLFV